LRVEMSLMNEEKKQAKLHPYLQTNSEEKNSSERKIKLNNAEQLFYISMIILVANLNFQMNWTSLIKKIHSDSCMSYRHLMK